MKDKIALLVAVAALLAMGAGVIYMASPTRVTGEELPWARLQYLFGAVEAIAFAGAGWLWGKEVHRQQAASATDAHIAARDSAEAKGKAEGTLKTLADAVLANAGAINRAQGDIGGGPGTGLSALVALAATIRKEL